MNTVERVKDLCKQRKISIHKLELECGFANGYIGQLRKGTLPDDRLGKIAEYLGVSAEYLRTGEEEQLILSEQADLWIKIRNDKRLLHSLKTFFELSDEKQEYVLGLINLFKGEL
mgnify:FL=1|jgi:transcriptional regulator with XRE-family HTH domain|nr:MAG TPA: repressor protein [Caudoviricetes sp.]